MGGNAGRRRYLASEPLRRMRYYNGYFINGYIFNTEAYGSHKSTTSWGVYARGLNYNLDKISYYEILKEVIKLFYHSRNNSTYYSSVDGLIFIGELLKTNILELLK